MLLRNLEIIGGVGTRDILVKDGKIDRVERAVTGLNGRLIIDFDDAIAFPGLINSHDHLDFNLFPKLGNRLYDNYVEWGRDIHKHNKETINNILRIPLALRAQWGVYKNLVNGITTVVNHGDFLNIGDPVISVFQQCNTIHSIRLEKYWKYKLNQPFAKKWPYVTHIGEGVDFNSTLEIDNLIKWNLCKRDIIGVHGIAMNERQAVNFKALVWCPDSNYFLVGETARINKLKYATDIVFGTDSTLSSGWNLWEQLRMARDENAVTDTELYNMMTVAAADLWQLDASGKLAASFDADIVVAKRKKGLDSFNAYYAIDPEDILLVVHKGRIRLFDAQLYDQLHAARYITNDFNKMPIGGSDKFIYGDVPGLKKQILHHYPGAVFPF